MLFTKAGFELGGAAPGAQGHHCSQYHFPTPFLGCVYDKEKKNAEVNSSGQMLPPASPTSNSLNQVNILCGHSIIEILALTLEVLSGTGFPETSLFYCDSYQLLLIGTYTFSSSTSGFYPSFLLGSTSSSLLLSSSSFLLSSSDLPFPFSVSSFSLPSSSLSSPVS